MIGIFLSRSHGIMPPPRRFAGQPPRALRAQVVRPANIPASGQNGIYRKNDTQLALLAFCTLRSYLATLQKQHFDLFQSLVQVFKGNTPQPNFSG
jgi:hypothetical protein